MYNNGHVSFSIESIDIWAEQHLPPEDSRTYHGSKVAEWLQNAKSVADIDNFDYYYNRLKKMTLLRGYVDIGFDMSWIYDPNNLIDLDKKQQQERYLDSKSPAELTQIIEERVNNVGNTLVNKASTDTIEITTEYLQELVSKSEKEPDVGKALYDVGGWFNGATRGARLGKFYLRSAASGVGKSRMMMADACTIACRAYYDPWTKAWVSTGNWKSEHQQGVLFISTELDKTELSYMALGFISGIDETKIRMGQIDFDQKPILNKACQILGEANIQFKLLPNFTIEDVENVIKRSIVKHNTRYIFYDYLGTSLGILEEISRRTRGISLREDNALFMLSTRLKDLAVEYNVFIMSATQLNGDWKVSSTPDQNLLRGAKSIADRLDFGSILLEATPDDKQLLAEKILPKIVKETGLEYPVPNMKLSVYKNRSGQFCRSYIWIYAKKGICRYIPLFATTWTFETIENFDKIQINDAGELIEL